MSTPVTPEHNPDAGPTKLLRHVGLRRHALVLVLIAVGTLVSWWFSSRSTTDVPATVPVEPTAVAPVPETSTPPAPTVAFHGLLNSMEDGAPFGETSAYLEMIRALRNQTPEEFAANPHARLDIAAAMKDPAAWRGRCVTRRGIIPVLWAERLKDPRAGITDVWRGILVEADGEDGIVFDLVDPPPDLKVRRDIIDVDGVFMRTVKYDKRNGKSEVVPYILARSLRVVTQTLKDAPREFVLGPGIPLMLLVFGGIWFVYRLSTLNRASKRSMRIDWLAPGRKAKSPLLRPTRSSKDGEV